MSKPSNQQQLRKQLTKQRKALTQKQRQRLALLASLHLPKLLPRLPTHAKIGLYLDAFGELPTAPILKFCQKHGFTAYLPITRANKPLSFVPVCTNLSKTPLKRHKLGIKEPFGKGVICAGKLDCIICPLVAVDKGGNRLGMGGGFYDRTFAKAPNVLTVGWCYHFQVVEKLAVNPWDKGVDMLITEKGMIRFDNAL